MRELYIFWQIPYRMNAEKRLDLMKRSLFPDDSLMSFCEIAFGESRRFFVCGSGDVIQKTNYDVKKQIGY